MSTERRPPSGHVVVGRVAGVPVRAHWSLLVILLLATQLLAVGVLPSALPGYGTGAYWLVGAGAALTFVATVLAHELAHAITARRHGIEVKQITLWALGGATEMSSEPASPTAEAAVAASGPAVSLGLGGVFAGLTWLVDSPRLVVAALAWLAAVNLVLAVFNLLPAAPLDGGRLLRALLWRRMGDWVRATQVSARAGSFLGIAVTAVGVVQVLGGALLGIWLVLVGLFVMGAATAERQAAVGRRLAGRVAGELMTTPAAVVPAWWTVRDLLAEMERSYTGQQVFPLVDFEGAPQRLLTVRDLERVPRGERDSTRLRDAARSRLPALAVAPDTPLSDLLLPIRAHGGIAVVVDDGRAVGTVTSAQLAAALSLATLSHTGRDDRERRPDVLVPH